jgi:hypothetical protein
MARGERIAMRILMRTEVLRCQCYSFGHGVGGYTQVEFLFPVLRTAVHICPGQVNCLAGGHGPFREN